MGKFLTATAVGALMLAGTAAQATTISFDPGSGTATGIPTGTSIIDLTSPQAPVQLDVMAWQAVNNNLSQPDWAIKSTNSTGTAFSETFTFVLEKTLLGLTTTGKFGDTDTADNPTNSYVSMVVDTHGVTKDGFTITGQTSPSDVHLAYTGGTMTMYFHKDGIVNDCTPGANTCNTDADVATIAVFDIQDGEANFDSGSTQVDLFWNAKLHSGTNTSLFDAAGNSLLGDGLFTFTDQGTKQVTDVTGVNGVDGGAQFSVSSKLTGQGNTKFSVPEPGTLALFGAGLLGLGACARRRRVKKLAVA
jgi:hypothetical protein